MDRSYEVYCFADPRFYDSPARIERPDVDFTLTRAELPPGWKRDELDDWVLIWPQDVVLPPQGWKIHASACMENAAVVLQTVWEYCLDRGIPFKFVRGQPQLLIRNAKYAPRGSSGKLAAIYPADEKELETTLNELGDRLSGQSGPYILSDLRWKSGPLYVRYGGFSELYCMAESGEPELAIFDERGELVPDRRGPTFEVPPWVPLPEFLEPHLAARRSTSVADLPYEITSAIHFSNGGGIYAGVDKRSGDKVVLKEARPYAGLAFDGADAVARLDCERRTLQRLADVEFVPGLRDHFILGEHHFIVEDFVDGRPLSDLIAERYPLALEAPSEERLREYTAWVVATLTLVEQAVDDIHARGIAIADLHPSNVLVQDDGRITMIDFEVAGDPYEPRQQTLADPAFMTPGGLTGIEVDRYALACLRLFAFLPLTQLIALHSDKAAELAAHISELFPVPNGFVEEAARTISDAWGQADRGSARIAGVRQSVPVHADRDDWPRIRESIRHGILASATPARHDRLFPGDIHQFSTGGLNIAYGAAGVLYALASTGCTRQPEFEEWLVSRATHPERGTRVGFYDGLHGVAWVLEYLSRRVEALKVLSICADEVAGNWDRIGIDLFSGLAGIGLNLAHFAEITGDPSLDEETQRIAEVLADRLGDGSDVVEISGGDYPYAGLLRGSSGPALFFIRLFDQRGDGALLDIAADALRQDLRRCLIRDDGSMEVNEGWRTMPYVADGSVGIGMVLEEYLARRPDEQFQQASEAIGGAARGQFYIEPGLLYGRAGMILYLARQHQPGSAYTDPVVAAHIRRLGWHALTYEGHLAFPGEQLLRLSMDLGTGSAGVLLALGAAMHDSPVHLPFLPPCDHSPSSSFFETNSTLATRMKGGE